MYSKISRWKCPVPVGGKAQSRHKGFTLIELLIVIAIITLLSAIVFPAYSRVRAKANQSTCASNLRQLGLAVGQYTQDNDEMEPMSEYMNGSCGETARSALMPYLKSNQLLVCPGSTSSFDLTYIFSNLGGVSACPDVPTADNYVLNNSVIPNAVLAGAAYQPVAISSLAQPSLTVAAYDGNLSGAANGFQWLVQGVHNGTVNLMFADGHVKDIATRQGDSTTRYDNPPTTNRITTYHLAANPYGCSGLETCQVLPP